MELKQWEFKVEYEYLKQWVLWLKGSQIIMYGKNTHWLIEVSYLFYFAFILVID